MKRLVLAIAVVAALALCSVAAAASLSGTFKAYVHNRAFSGALVGTWTITLSGGNYKVAEGGSVLLSGRYSVSGNKIVIGGGGAGDFCRVKGTYSFRLSANKLSFTKISDNTKACRGRVDVLTSGPFTRT